MSPSASPSAAAHSPAPAGFPRRTLLAASAAGLGLLLVAGCTNSAGEPRDQPSSRQTDALAAQVTVQETLVAAYAAAGAADSALAAQIADLAAQAGRQLDRLKAAAPRAVTRSSAASSSPSPSAGPSAVPSGQDPRTWLRSQVAAAADAHAAACLDQTGARAALLGSIAAGLRGQDARLA